jgi:hypothetical protein
VLTRVGQTGKCTEQDLTPKLRAGDAARVARRQQLTVRTRLTMQ